MSHCTKRLRCANPCQQRCQSPELRSFRHPNCRSRCDEIWLEGCCNTSCNRCGVMAVEQPDMSGARNVFDAFTAQQPLAPTPPTGWNSWNQFGCDIDETLIRETADAMVSSGMLDAGYQYVNIDHCWQAKERDGSGNLVADPVRFPSGIEAIAQYVHELGLKLGVYSDRGTHTCAGYPGSFGHEIEDAETFASWGVDYLKYDNCNVPKGRENGAEMQEDYAITGEAPRRTERPMVYSICAWWLRLDARRGPPLAHDDGYQRHLGQRPPVWLASRLNARWCAICGNAKDLGHIAGGYEATVPSHRVVILELCGDGTCETVSQVDTGCVDCGGSPSDARDEQLNAAAAPSCEAAACEAGMTSPASGSLDAAEPAATSDAADAG